ncbi:hypothetical protein [Psychromonas sp. GE-S-Ul-11]|uniref:hypothetical protein n=2 Tax=Psychromonas sp. GE-S-Ul-11 TaxID=3241170 RepID=UPI00390C5FC7
MAVQYFFPNDKVQFERNVSHFDLDKCQFEKKEIDICIFSDSNLKCAIELKFPRNGQVPETMFSFCKDILFLEQLVMAGFESAHFIALVDEHLFYEGQTGGIYGLFRNGQPITGLINKPTGAKDSSVLINGSYIAKWQVIDGNSKYCVISIYS